MAVSLAEARLLLAHARRAIQQGNSPSRSKVERRVQAVEALAFGKWAEKYVAEATLAGSTRAMRRSVYDRNLAAEFDRLKLEEITPSRLMAKCEKIKERGAAARAVQARDIVLQAYRFVQARGLKVDNPAEAIRPSAIATFKPRDRALTSGEIHVFFSALELGVQIGAFHTDGSPSGGDGRGFEPGAAFAHAGAAVFAGGESA